MRVVGTGAELVVLTGAAGVALASAGQIRSAGSVACAWTSKTPAGGGPASSRAPPLGVGGAFGPFSVPVPVALVAGGEEKAPLSGPLPPPSDPSRATVALSTPPQWSAAGTSRRESSGASRGKEGGMTPQRCVGIARNFSALGAFCAREPTSMTAYTPGEPKWSATGTLGFELSCTSRRVSWWAPALRRSA